MPVYGRFAPTCMYYLWPIFVHYKYAVSVVLSCKPLPGISDHKIAFVELLTNIELQNSIRTCKLWHKADMDSIHEVITNFNNEFLHCNIDAPIDALWNKFKDMCHVYYYA